MIQVAVRLRPERQSAVEIESDTVRVLSREFKFDRVFDGGATQDDVFEYLRPQLDRALEGYSATIFAYGQTGSGKTYTMLNGIMPRAVRHIYSRSGAALITLTCCEVYKESVYDLMDHSPKRPALPVIGFTVPGLASKLCATAEEMIRTIEAAAGERVTAPTAKNATSSRSHAIMTLTVEEDGATAVVRLVDLAGSESAGDTPQETKAINQSLIHLSTILELLSKPVRPLHLPYRNSKLTSILKDALGGTSLCTIIACIRGGGAETLNTLRYAASAKLIKNTPVKNKDTRRIKSIRDQLQTIQETQPPHDGRLQELYDYMKETPGQCDNHLKFILTLMGKVPEIVPMFVSPELQSFCDSALRLTLLHVEPASPGPLSNRSPSSRGSQPASAGRASAASKHESDEESRGDASPLRRRSSSQKGLRGAHR
jgi:hypothetical protein